MWRNRVAFRPTFLELLDDADVDARVVFVDAWTSVGGSQFVDSAGQRPLPHLPLRRGRPVRRRALRDERPARSGREVERRLRRRGHRDASPRPLPGLREPCRRRPLRRLDPAVLPRRGPPAARRLRRLDRSLPRGAPHRPGAARASRRPPRAAPVGLRRRVLRRRRRDGPPPVRHRDRGGDPGALGALARVGLPDARPPPRRRPSRACARSTSTAARATSGTST